MDTTQVEDAMSILWVKTREVAKYLTRQKRTPYNQELLASNIKSTKLEKPCLWKSPRFTTCRGHLQLSFPPQFWTSRNLEAGS